MGARRQRRAGRAAEHDLGVPALDQVGDVGVPVADRAGPDLALADAVGVEERPQRLEDQQGRAAVQPRPARGFGRCRLGLPGYPWLTGTLQRPQPCLRRGVNRHHAQAFETPPPARARSAVRAPRRGRLRGRLPRPGRLLRGLQRAAEPLDPRQGLRTDAPPRRPSAAGRALLGHGWRPPPPAPPRPNFNADDPANYNWSEYDPILAEAKRLGWQVLLTVTSPVPRWATSNLKAPYVTRPDSQDFREFMTAVARHFGSEVTTYAIWSEPNHPAFLQPQFASNGSPASPRIYRGLYQAGYLGLQEAGLDPPAGAVRRNRAHRIRLGQEPAEERKIQSPGARRGAAGVPARSAVPELPLPQGRRLQRAADERLRPPRLHDRGAAELQDSGLGQRHDRRALEALERPQPRRRGHTPCRPGCRST